MHAIPCSLGWQPFNTAPKEVSIDIWVGSLNNLDYGRRVTGVCLVNGELHGKDTPSLEWGEIATHWMHIPARPFYDLNENVETIELIKPEQMIFPEYHSSAMGCGLEDRGIRDRYEAMRYGWDCAFERFCESIPEEWYSVDEVAILVRELNAALVKIQELKTTKESQEPTKEQIDRGLTALLKNTVYNLKEVPLHRATTLNVFKAMIRI